MKKKLLIVDDDELTLQLYDLLLEDLDGITFRTESSGSDALSFLEGCSQREWPDFIFVDLHMPDMTGYEFVEEFQNRFTHRISDSQLYVLTSSVSQRDIQNGRNYPVIQDFLSKPLTEESLNRLLEGAH